jgi:predicted AAA+ superfamily ATPase
LKEEIILEQTVRQIEPFTRFLEVASQSNGELLNYENIAKDVKVSSVTVKTYFQILEDTLIGFMLPAYHTSVRKKQKQSPKFYFYDVGIVRALRNHLSQAPLPETFEFGALFESFLINEIIRKNEYKRSRFQFSHFRIDDKQEIDLVIERPDQSILLVEMKSRDSISEREVGVLNMLLPSFPKAKAYCLSRDPIEKKIGETWCLPWETGIEEIWNF